MLKSHMGRCISGSLIGAAFVWLAATIFMPDPPALAWWHGGSSTCPYPTYATDGCAGTPIGSVKTANFFTSAALQSGQTYATRPAWNVAGVDYAIGVPQALLAGLPDVTTVPFSGNGVEGVSLPAACAYSAPNAEIFCGNSSNLGPAIISGFNWSAQNGHGCISLYINQHLATGTTITIKDNYWQNASGSTSCTSNNGGAKTFIGGQSGIVGGAQVSIDIENNTFDGNSANNTATGFIAILAVHAEAGLTLKYNAFINLTAGPIRTAAETSGCCGDVNIKYNYFGNWCSNNGGAHCEILESVFNPTPYVVVWNNMNYLYNTSLLGSNISNTGATATFYVSTGAPGSVPTDVTETMQHVLIDHNVAVLNLLNGFGGTKQDTPTVDWAYDNYGTNTITNNYLDQTGCCLTIAHPYSYCDNIGIIGNGGNGKNFYAFQFAAPLLANNNIDLVSGTSVDSYFAQPYPSTPGVGACVAPTASASLGAFLPYDTQMAINNALGTTDTQQITISYWTNSNNNWGVFNDQTYITSYIGTTTEQEVAPTTAPGINFANDGIFQRVWLVPSAGTVKANAVVGDHSLADYQNGQWNHFIISVDTTTSPISCAEYMNGVQLALADCPTVGTGTSGGIIPNLNAVTGLHINGPAQNSANFAVADVVFDEESILCTSTTGFTLTNGARYSCLNYSGTPFIPPFLLAGYVYNTGAGASASALGTNCETATGREPESCQTGSGPGMLTNQGLAPNFLAQPSSIAGPNTSGTVYGTNTSGSTVNVFTDGACSTSIVASTAGIVAGYNISGLNIPLTTVATASGSANTFTLTSGPSATFGCTILQIWNPFPYAFGTQGTINDPPAMSYGPAGKAANEVVTGQPSLNWYTYAAAGAGLTTVTTNSEGNPIHQGDLLVIEISLGDTSNSSHTPQTCPTGWSGSYLSGVSAGYKLNGGGAFVYTQQILCWHIAGASESGAYAVHWTNTTAGINIRWTLIDYSTPTQGNITVNSNAGTSTCTDATNSTTLQSPTWNTAANGSTVLWLFNQFNNVDTRGTAFTLPSTLTLRFAYPTASKTSISGTIPQVIAMDTYNVSASTSVSQSMSTTIPLGGQTCVLELENH